MRPKITQIKPRKGGKDDPKTQAIATRNIACIGYQVDHVLVNISQAILLFFYPKSIN